jgi:hypothetical protein
MASVNKIGTITVQPSSLQTKFPPHEIYDHTFFGEHEFSVSVLWTVKPSMPAIPTIITDRVAPLVKTFKVMVTSVCTDSLLKGGPDPPIDISSVINHIPDRSRIFMTFGEV